MNDRISLPMCGIATFAKSELCEDLDNLNKDVDVAFLGAPYDQGTAFRPGCRFGPRAVREASTLSARKGGFYNAELDVMMLEDVKIVDCGDADMLHADLHYCFDHIKSDVRKIVKAGAMPLVMGGDHSITIPVLRALDNVGSFCVVQFDAHLDWTEGPAGQTLGQGNPMRRASELPYVETMAQVGIRGVGSSNKLDFEAARAYGSEIIYASQVRREGVEKALARIPKCEQYYITIDVDGIDPSIMSGTGTPSIGGLDYYEIMGILEGITKMGNIVGIDMVELSPVYDQSELSAQMAVQILNQLLGYVFLNKKNK